MTVALENALPDVIDAQERNKVVYGIVPWALNEVFGEEGDRRDTKKRPSSEGSGITT